MPRRRRRDPSWRYHELRPEAGDVHPHSSEDDLVAIDYTSGGAPYGLTVREWRQAQESGERAAGWARAKRALDGALRAAAVPRAVVDVGWVSHVGRGLWRDAFAAEVLVQPDPDALSGSWVALVPRGDTSGSGDPEAETRLLDWLRERRPPFRVPRALTAAQGAGTERLLVRELVRGVPLDPRAGRQPGV